MTNFVRRSLLNPRGQISGGYSVRKLDNSLQATSGSLRGNTCQDQRDEKRECRGQEQRSANLPHHGRHIGKWIGQSHRPARNGGSNV